MKDNHKTKPYLSIVAATRNDNHGGNMKLRMQVFINCLAAQSQRHALPTELLLVEWNPPREVSSLAEALDWPEDNEWLRIIVVRVPQAIHHRYKHAQGLPLYQMIAKNVGIRRAEGNFVLCTNVDIVFSDELFALLAARELEPGKLYRSERYDVGNKLDPDWELEKILQYCNESIIRVNTMDYTYNLKSESKHIVYPEDATEDTLGRAKLFTNACGDFTLLSRGDWFDLCGYVEWDIFSFHLDSLFLYEAHYSGRQEVVLPPTLPHYHIEHLEGWTPEIHKSGILQDSLEKGKIETLSNNDLRELIWRMAQHQEPLQDKRDDWGLVRENLPQIKVVVTPW